MPGRGISSSPMVLPPGNHKCKNLCQKVCGTQGDKASRSFSLWGSLEKSWVGQPFSWRVNGERRRLIPLWKWQSSSHLSVSLLSQTFSPANRSKDLAPTPAAQKGIGILSPRHSGVVVTFLFHYPKLSNNSYFLIQMANWFSLPQFNYS